MGEQLTIRSLELSDAPALSAMLCAQCAVYAHFFNPFKFDEATITGILRERERDVYMGVFWNGEIIGFFMLRGWDAGYTVPTYGVLIAERYRGYGLAPLSLRMAKIICKTTRAPRLMLKVDSENASAKAVFEKERFIPAGEETRGGKLIYYFDINEQRAKS